MDTLATTVFVYAQGSALLKVTQSVGGRVETERRAPKVQPAVLHSTGATAGYQHWLRFLPTLKAG